MRDLHPDELVSPRMRAIASSLGALGWYTECTEARHAWPYATLWGDHASSARLFVGARWGNKLNAYGHKRFPGSRYSFWFSPPSPSTDRRSLWFSLKREAPLMEMAANPYQPIADSVWRQGFIPRQQTGCGCDKLQLYGEDAAVRALARAQEARAAGVEWRRECRFYQCPDDARAFHLTSMEARPPRV